MPVQPRSDVRTAEVLERQVAGSLTAEPTSFPALRPSAQIGVESGANNSTSAIQQVTAPLAPPNDLRALGSKRAELKLERFFFGGSYAD